MLCWCDITWCESMLDGNSYFFGAKSTLILVSFLLVMSVNLCETLSLCFYYAVEMG